MPVCALCGITNATVVLCAHHTYEHGTTWSQANKIWCDLFHRGIPITRLPEQDREDA